MKIPEVRERLYELVTAIGEKAKTYGDLELYDYSRTLFALTAELVRRPAVKKTKPKARKMTAKLRDMVRAYYRANPGLSNREIGAYFNIDGGRVSEALAGFRE